MTLAVLLAAALHGCAGAPQPLVPRRALAAAELNGIVYVAGGWNGASTQLDVVEAFDPRSGRVSTAIPLRQPRSQHGLVAADGRLWIVAGWSAETGLVREVESWSPGDRAWRPETRLPTPRREPGVAVTGRRIVVAGGFSGESDTDLDGYSTAVEAYDLDARAWQSLSPLRTPRRGLALIDIGGALFAFGGYNAHDGFLSAVERYDAGADAWTAVDWPIAPRTWLAVVADGADAVMLGGFDVHGQLDVVQRVRTADGHTCTAPPLRVARSWLAAVALGPGRALTFGGETPAGFRGDIEHHSTDCLNET